MAIGQKCALRFIAVVDEALDREHLQELLEQRASRQRSHGCRARAPDPRRDGACPARRLQPHFIAAFFLEALKRLGGRYYEREPHRYEITRVPAIIRNRIPRGDTRASHSAALRARGL